MAKGYRGRGKNCVSIATRRVQKGLEHAYKHRKQKKRDFRSMWIQSVNAGVREHGLNYSRFVNQLNISGIDLNRKSLSALAQTEPFSFRAVVEIAKQNGPALESIKKVYETGQQYVAVPREHFADMEPYLANTKQFTPVPLEGKELEEWLKKGQDWAEKNTEKEPEDPFDDYLKEDP